jgi:hypothetical protein
MNKEDFLKGVFDVLEETFESSKGAAGSIYLDRKIGVFETLEKITAERASQVVNDTTIAAHTEHLRFYVWVLNESLTGDITVNWADSWRVLTVNEIEWEELQTALREIYQTTRETLQNVDEWNAEKVGEAVAIIAHTAYHFGAIRQILKAV